MDTQFDVFISYSRKNTDFVNRLVTSLEVAGLKIWIDRGGIEGGSQWEKEIRKGLRNSRIVLVIISQASMESYWVDNELGRAEKLGKEILPVQIEELDPDTDYRMSLDGIHWLRAVEDQSDGQVDQIVTAARRKVESTPPMASPKAISSEIATKTVVEAEAVVEVVLEAKIPIASVAPYEHDVFIAYSPLNQGFADAVYKYLNAANFRVWMDLDGTCGGEISKTALCASRLMLVIVSGPAIRSEVVKTEVEAAIQRRTPLLRVNFSDLKEGTVYPKELDTASLVDARRDTSREKLEEIVEKARQMLESLESEMGPVSSNSVEVDEQFERDEVGLEKSRLEKLAGPGVAGAQAIGPLVKGALSGKIDPDIFISYSHGKAHLAEALCQILQNEEFDIWMAANDSEDNLAGDRKNKEALRNSRLVILEISEASLSSKVMQEGLAMAAQLNLPILPVQVEALKAETVVPQSLKWLEWIDARTEQTPVKLTQIVEAVHKKLDELIANPSVLVGKRNNSESANVDSPLQKAMTFRGPKEGRIFAALRAGAADVEARDRLDKTALHYAVGKQEMEIVRLLLSRQANVNAVDKSGNTPLHMAVTDVDLTRLLMLAGGNFYLANNVGKTPYDLAVEARATNTIYLLDLLDQVNKGTREPNNALSEALGLNSWKSQRILNAVAAGATDVSMRDIAGRTALHWAAQENEPELTKLLLERGADPQAIDKAGNTPARLARNRGYMEIGELLFDYQADPLASAKGLHTDEALEGDFQVDGGEVEDPNEVLETALALKSGHKAKRIFNAVLGGATNLKAADQLGRTALHWAVSKGELEIVRTILQRGGHFDIDAATSDGETALHYAAKDDLADIALILLESGASSEAKEKYLCTPLHVSSIRGAAAVTKVLLQNGATTEARNALEETPLHSSMADDNAGIARLLVDHGAAIEARNELEETPLHTAAYYDAVQCARLLLSLGADHSAQDVSGQTPLTLAPRNGRVFRLLRKAGAQ